MSSGSLPPSEMAAVERRDAARLEIGRLSEAEAEALRSFTNHSIMVETVRQASRPHWGLCPRHAWAQAAVEIELRAAAPAPDSRPFETAIFHDGLLGEARRALTSRRHGSHRPLARRGRCHICVVVDEASATHTVAAIERSGLAGPVMAEGQFAHMSGWLGACKHEWAPARCPGCTNNQTPGAIVCRDHLLTGGLQTRDETAAYLSGLHRRVRNLIRSMTGQAEPSTADDAALVETLGWFHGWAYPTAATTDTASPPVVLHLSTD